MQVRNIVLGIMAVASLAGCESVGGNKVDYKTGAVETQSLEVPPDLVAHPGSGRAVAPVADTSQATSYSEYSRREEIQKGLASAVLPEVKGVRLARDGDKRWLVVNDKPENVWPVVKAFWQENGLTLASEDPSAGVMETEWVENRAKIPQDFIRRTLGKVVDGLYSTGERDRYRTRLERDGASTSLYITHYGKEEVLDKDKVTTKWQNRPNDPELEAIMLQKLMVRFGSSEEQAASELAAAPAASPAQAGSGKASLRDGTIVIEDAFDRAWRRVGLAIDAMEMEIEDRDRSKGLYFLRQPKKKSGWLDKLFSRESDADAQKRYRVHVTDGGKSSTVSVTDPDGHSDETSQKLTAEIYRQINR